MLPGDLAQPLLSLRDDRWRQSRNQRAPVSLIGCSETTLGHEREPMMDRRTQTRMVGAAVMMVASATVGLVAGRMSAWVVPVETARSPEVRSVKPKTAEPPKPVVLALPSSEPQAQLHTEPTRRDVPQGQEVPLNVATGYATPEMSASAAPPQLTIVNPHSATSDFDAGDEGTLQLETVSPAVATGSLDSAVAQCERRYSSFRRSDGTYQPFGSGTRRPCPLLR